MTIPNLDELLLTVQKPGRYIGGEWNAVKKEWTGDKVKVLLAFPDTYEVGMSYLGMKILYGILNARPDCLAERVFSPWIDFEAVLRNNKIPLFSLESRKPIKDFDIIGVCLTYELGYSNLLNLLDLGGIPKRSSERSDDDPIILAGGPSCYNPEPVSDFVDAFLIGDGEEAIGEIVEAYKGSRVIPRLRSGQEGQGSRKKVLREMAKIKGVYVPSLYKVEYNSDNTIKNFSPIYEDIPSVIEKRVVRDLDNAFYPTDQIVPCIQIVHDRIVLEIMRGCKHACRFCQATTTYRPCRERSKDTILKLAGASYDSTGYDEISLLSLSSGDHSGIREIIKELNDTFRGKAVSVSVPSLRVEDVLKDLPGLISHVKKSGLTFAPEAGSDCLRNVINKNIDIEKLFNAVTESIKSGWRRVKLYFMIGLPSEKEDDILAMSDLISRISGLRKEAGGKPIYVTASINAFVPKPHTPFQWNAMESLEELSKKRELLRERLRSRTIELDFHSFKTGFIEAAFARGDRRLGGVIYEAWSSGAKFDGWGEYFKPEIWLDAFKKAGIDPAFYAARQRRHDEILPWDFIDIGIKKERFLREAAAAEDTPI